MSLSSPHRIIYRDERQGEGSAPVNLLTDILAFRAVRREVSTGHVLQSIIDDFVKAKGTIEFCLPGIIMFSQIYFQNCKSLFVLDITGKTGTANKVASHIRHPNNHVNFT